MTRDQIDTANRGLRMIVVGHIQPQCGEGHDELLAIGSKDGERALVILFWTPSRVTHSEVIKVGR